MNDQLKGQIKDRILYRPDSIVILLKLSVNQMSEVTMLDFI